MYLLPFITDNCHSRICSFLFITLFHGAVFPSVFFSTICFPFALFFLGLFFFFSKASSCRFISVKKIYELGLLSAFICGVRSMIVLLRFPRACYVAKIFSQLVFLPLLSCSYPICYNLSFSPPTQNSTFI